MTTSIMGDAPVATFGKENHLIFPCIGTERPSMAENYGLTGSPVFIVDMCSILRSDCRHAASFVEILKLK
jgi:hypothetical protein